MTVPSELDDALRNAGWTPGRSDPEMAEHLSRHNVAASHPAFKALTEFGALTLGGTRKGEQCSTSNIFLDLLVEEDPNAKAWANLLETQLVGFAWTDNSHGQLYMAEDGRVFGNSVVHDAFYFLGIDLREALLRLLCGRRAIPMLRPDQTSITLYGDTFVEGDAGLYAWRR